MHPLSVSRRSDAILSRFTITAAAGTSASAAAASAAPASGAPASAAAASAAPASGAPASGVSGSGSGGAIALQRARVCLGAALLFASALQGCAQAPAPAANPQAVHAFAQQGYHPDGLQPIESQDRALGEFDVLITAPIRRNSMPVVIYLPGLGESRWSAAAWRRAWAEAGYMVISVQPLADAPPILRKQDGGPADAAILARPFYRGEALQTRLLALQSLLRVLRAQQQSGAQPYARADLEHLAVAGYDLGAYSALLLAGEHARDVTAVQPAVRPRAVIALSPYADFGGLPFSERYGAVQVPVLSITGEADADPAAVVSTPALHRVPFEYLPPGRNALLSLTRAPHHFFAGDFAESTHPAGIPGEEARPAQQAAAGALERSVPDGKSNETGANGGLPGGTDGGSGGSNRSGRSGHRGGGQGAGQGSSRSAQGQRGVAGLSATATEMIAAGLEAVSTAFLDSVLKGDSVAADWLQRDANPWLGTRGQLRTR